MHEIMQHLQCQGTGILMCDKLNLDRLLHVSHIKPLDSKKVIKVPMHVIIHSLLRGRG